MRNMVPRREAMSINNGFWDLPADERGAAYEATGCLDSSEFFSLPVEERSAVYDRYRPRMRPR